MQIGRIASGLIFDSRLTQDERDWIVTPNEGSHTWLPGGGIVLQSGAMILRPIPEEIDFGFQITIEPDPQTGTCGLILYRSQDYQIRLSVFNDGAPNPTALQVRRTDGTYLFMAEIGGVWHVVGSVRDDQVYYMGAFAADGASLTITHAICTAEEDIIVQGLDDGDEVKIIDGGGNEWSAVAVEGVAIIDLGWLHSITGTLKIISGGNEVVSLDGTFYSGDIWAMELPVAIRINGEPVAFGAEYTLDFLEPQETLLLMEIENISSEPLVNRTVQVVAYPPFTGHEWADIAPDVGGQPGDWSNVVIIDQLDPTFVKRVWVRIQRQFDRIPYSPSKYARFRVVFS